MVDEPAATDDENKDKKSGSGAEIAHVVADGAIVLAALGSAASVPSTAAASDGSAAGSVATPAASGAVVADAVDAVGVADVADAAGNVVGVVLGVLDAL